jgi:hypothetical protein
MREFMNVRRRGIVFTGVLAFALGPVAGADAGSASKHVTVTLTKKDCEWNRKKGTARIVLAGTTTELPPGTKVAILLNLNYKEVGACIVTVNPDGTFADAVLEPAMRVHPDSGYELTGAIRLEDQAPKLLEPVKKALAQLKYQPVLGKVSIGTPQEQKEETAKLSKFMKDLVDQAVGLNNELADEAGAAEKKNRYQTKEGEFDPAAWREFVDKKWRPKVIELQKKFNDWKTQNPAAVLKFEAGAIHMEELLRTVALRSILLSRGLYLAAKKRVAPEDVTPPADLDTRPQFSNVRTDKKALAVLGKCYKIVKEDFKLEPPKKPDEGKGGAKGPQVESGKTTK